jgi:hypothetical protein
VFVFSQAVSEIHLRSEYSGCALWSNKELTRRDMAVVARTGLVRSQARLRQVAASGALAVVVSRGIRRSAREPLRQDPVLWQDAEPERVSVGCHAQHVHGIACSGERRCSTARSTGFRSDHRACATQQHLRDFTHGHPHPFSPLVSQAALNDIRGFEMCRKLQSPAGITIASCDLMNLARAFAEQFVIGTPFPAPWYSSFMHRVIILMAAVQQVHVADDRAKGLERSRGACRAFEHDCMTEAGLGIAGEGLTAARFLFHLMLDQETMTLDSLFDMQRRWIDPPAR